MFNINKAVNLIEANGLKKGKFCTDKLGVPRQYLDELERGKRKIENVPEDIVFKMARELGTSFEYLMDITDDPDPNFLLKETESLEERIVHEVMYKLAEIPEEHKESLSRLFQLPDEEFRRAMDMLNLMWRK